ncbi:MAG: rod shape-determining protein MreC [Deltaproteobacteria bacterium]
MLPSRPKLIKISVFVLALLLIVFLAYRNTTYLMRAEATDAASFPLILLRAVTHEVRAVALFHPSYWNGLRLRRENAALKQDKLHAEEALAENARLRELLGLKESVAYTSVAANVIGKEFHALRPYLILNKGAAAGVSRFDPVVSPGGLAGKVLEVGRFSSKAMLIQDPDLAVPAMNQRTREQGLVSGTLDGRCKMRFLDIDSDTREGDLVITSGLNMTYPAGILIGIVRFVGIEPSGLGRFAYVEPAVRPGALEEVLIITAHGSVEN